MGQVRRLLPGNQYPRLARLEIQRDFLKFTDPLAGELGAFEEVHRCAHARNPDPHVVVR